jgi:quinol monooxygenase YgiN
MTVRVVATVPVKPGEQERVLAALRPLIAASQGDEGRIEYVLYRPVDDANTFVMIEEWESAELLKKHSEAAHSVAFGAAVGELLAGAPIITVCERVE